MSFPTPIKQLQGKRFLIVLAKDVLRWIATAADISEHQTHTSGDYRIDYTAYGAAKAAWRAAHPDASDTEDDQAMRAIASTYGV